MSKSNKVYYFLIFACVFVWVIMMGSKNVYVAEIEEIMAIFGTETKSVASFGMTLYFITYAVVQILLFFFMGKLCIKWYMVVTMALSGGVTILIAFATGMNQLWWILAVNGVLQAGVWGMCIAVLDKYLPSKLKPVANAIMNIGTAVAGVITYGSSAIFVGMNRWDLPHIILGIILAFSGVLFFVAVCLAEKAKKNVFTDSVLEEKKEKEVEPFISLNTKSSKAWFYVITFALSFLIHCLLYGVMNWVPSLVEYVYGQPRPIAILLTVVVPIVIAIGPVFAVWHCEKQNNYVWVMLLYILISLFFAVLLIFVYAINLTLSLIVIILFLLVVQSTVTVIFSVVSFKMGKFINTGAHGSLMNAAGALSAGIAPTLIGAIIDIHGKNTGWQLNYIIVAIFTAIIAVILTIILFMVKKLRLKGEGK